MFEAITKYSPKSFYELKLYEMDLKYLFPEDLESFLINWKNQKSQKSLNLIIAKYYDIDTYNILDKHEENIKVIKKYKRLGIIKNFGFETFYDFDDAFNDE